MILPTLNGESVDPTGQPALKTEERKVNGFPTWWGGRLSGKGFETLPAQFHISAFSPALISKPEQLMVLFRVDKV